MYIKVQVEILTRYFSPSLLIYCTGMKPLIELKEVGPFKSFAIKAV